MTNTPQSPANDDEATAQLLTVPCSDAELIPDRFWVPKANIQIPEQVSHRNAPIVDPELCDSMAFFKF
jgi:hypothetical protein